jgi:hypothetical protein
LFCDAWISMRFARCANLSVLWVSSELFDAGVTVQISWKRKKMVTINPSTFTTSIPMCYKELTETRPWPLSDDWSSRVNLESRYGTCVTFPSVNFDITWNTEKTFKKIEHLPWITVTTETCVLLNQRCCHKLALKPFKLKMSVNIIYHTKQQ